MGKGDRKTRKGKRFINSPRKGARHEYTKSGNKNMSKHSKKCTFYTLRFGCSFAAVNTIKPQLL